MAYESVLIHLTFPTIKPQPQKIAKDYKREASTALELGYAQSTAPCSYGIHNYSMTRRAFRRIFIGPEYHLIH